MILQYGTGTVTGNIYHFRDMGHISPWYTVAMIPDLKAFAITRMKMWSMSLALQWCRVINDVIWISSVRICLSFQWAVPCNGFTRCLLGFVLYLLDMNVEWSASMWNCPTLLFVINCLLMDSDLSFILVVKPIPLNLAVILTFPRRDALIVHFSGQFFQVNWQKVDSFGQFSFKLLSSLKLTVA